MQAKQLFKCHNKWQNLGYFWAKGPCASTLSLAVAILFSFTGATVQSCCQLFSPMPREYLTVGCGGWSPPACFLCSGNCLIPRRQNVPVHPLLWPAWVLSTLLRVIFSPFILSLAGSEGSDRSDLFRCNLHRVLYSVGKTCLRYSGIWSLSLAEVMMATWHAVTVDMEGRTPGEVQHRGLYSWGNLPSHCPSAGLLSCSRRRGRSVGAQP